MNRLVHFEIHGKDMDRLQKFYEAVFGWAFQDMGAQMGGYRLITTGTDSQGEQWPGINGGMNPRKEDLPTPGQPVNAFVCTMSVEDIDKTLATIEAHGGTVATPKMEVPGVGWLAYRKDPEGNIFGVLQPAPRQS